MLPIPVNTMLRPVGLPSSPVLSPLRRSSLPRSFTELEISDLEKMLLPKSPVRKGSLQFLDPSTQQALDLESMLSPKSPVRRGSSQFRPSPTMSEYDTVLSSKPSDFDLTMLHKSCHESALVKVWPRNADVGVLLFHFLCKLIAKTSSAHEFDFFTLIDSGCAADIMFLVIILFSTQKTSY